VTKTKYWLSIISITVVLIAGSLAVSPIAIADDDEDDEEGDDDACSPDFTCIPSDDDEVCPAGFTCEEECDDGDDCELKECEVNGDDDGICTRPVGPTCEIPPDPGIGNLIIFVHEDNMGFCGIECTVREINGCTTSDVLASGATDGNGMLALTIPSGLSTISIRCDTIAVGGFFSSVTFPVTEPITFADIPHDSFSSSCCPTF